MSECIADLGWYRKRSPQNEEGRQPSSGPGQPADYFFDLRWNGFAIPWPLVGKIVPKIP